MNNQTEAGLCQRNKQQGVLPERYLLDFPVDFCRIFLWQWLCGADVWVFVRGHFDREMGILERNRMMSWWLAVLDKSAFYGKRYRQAAFELTYCSLDNWWLSVIRWHEGHCALATEGHSTTGYLSSKSSLRATVHVVTYATVWVVFLKLLPFEFQAHFVDTLGLVAKLYRA